MVDPVSFFEAQEPSSLERRRGTSPSDPQKWLVMTPNYGVMTQLFLGVMERCRCILPRDVRTLTLFSFSFLPTDGFSIKPLSVKTFGRGAESNQVYFYEFPLWIGIVQPRSVRCFLHFHSFCHFPFGFSKSKSLDYLLHR